MGGDGSGRRKLTQQQKAVAAIAKDRKNCEAVQQANSLAKLLGLKHQSTAPTTLPPHVVSEDPCLNRHAKRQSNSMDGVTSSAEKPPWVRARQLTASPCHSPWAKHSRCVCCAGPRQTPRQPF